MALPSTSSCGIVKKYDREMKVSYHPKEGPQGGHSGYLLLHLDG